MRDIIKMFIVLTVICCMSGVSLSILKDKTKDKIADQEIKFVKEPAVLSVLAGFDNDPMIERKEVEFGNDVSKLMFPAKKDGELFALAMEVSDVGYGGDVNIMLGIDIEGQIRGISITKHKETPGLGARISEAEFTKQFKTLSVSGDIALTSKGGKIEAISGATISSKAVVKAVSDGVAIFKDNIENIKNVF